MNTTSLLIDFFTKHSNISFCLITEKNLDLTYSKSKDSVVFKNYELSIETINDQKIIIISCLEHFYPSISHFNTLNQIFKEIPQSTTTIYWGFGCALQEDLSRGSWVCICDQINFDSMPWLYDLLPSNLEIHNSRKELFTQSIISEFNNAGWLCGIPLKLTNSMYFPNWLNVTPSEINVARICQADLISSRLSILSIFAKYYNLNFASLVCCIHSAGKQGQIITSKLDQEDYYFFSQQSKKLFSSFLNLSNQNQCSEELLLLLTANLNK